jgi:transposase
VQELPLRWLVVESTQLAKAKAPRLAATQQAEQAMLADLHQQWQRRSFACEADARQAAALCLRELRLHSYHLTYAVSAEWMPAKRAARGRPPKDAPRPQCQVWRVTWQVQAAPDAIRLRAQRECRFVLATNVLDGQQLSDADLLRAYKGQPAVELSFKWAKHPAAIAPTFLERPTRIAALGCVYLIALLVYTLVERHVRKSLTARGKPCPIARRPASVPRPAPSSTSCATLPWSCCSGQGKRIGT